MFARVLRIAGVLFLVILSSVSTIAQESALASASIHHKWTTNGPDCDQIVLDGTAYRIIRRDGLTIATAISATSDYSEVEVLVINKSDKRILVDPANSLIVFWKGPNKPDSKPEFLTPIPAEKIAKKMEKRARIAAALRSFGASMSTQQQTFNSTDQGSVMVISGPRTATGTYSGTSTTTTTTPDYGAQRRAEEKNAVQRARAHAAGASIQDMELRANTVFPDGSVGGQIYFPKKSFKSGLFAIRIDGVYYGFGISGK